VKVLKFLLAAVVLVEFLGNSESFGAAASSATQTVAGGGVTAKVTYLNPKSSDDPQFQVMLDTHSVNLDAYDLKSITVLRDDTGKNYVPTAAENKGSGHHREVILVFAKVSSETKRLELVIMDVAGVKERSFRWNREEGVKFRAR
jgi:hypothetical protein